MRTLTSLREKLAHIVLSAAVAGLVVAGLAACGGNDVAPSPTAVPTAVPTAMPTAAPTDTPAAMGGTGGTATPSGGTMSGSEQTATASLKEWSIDLNPAGVSAGKVKYTVTNDGELTHDLVILDSSGNQVGATTKFGKAQNPQTLEVDLKPGTYTFLCDIPGHAQAGMKTEVTIK